jgi:transcription initiation factor TFIIB
MSKRYFKYIYLHYAVSHGNNISVGKDPMGLAATVPYVSSLKTGEKITKTEIAKSAGVTEVTLRNRFKDLKGTLELN